MVQSIKDSPRQSLRGLAKGSECTESTIRNLVHKVLDMKSNTHYKHNPEEVDGGTWSGGAFLAERDVASPVPRPQSADYSIWSVLQERVQGTSHPSMESLNSHIKEAWDTLDEAFIASSCRSFQSCKEAVISANGSYIE